MPTSAHSVYVKLSPTSDFERLEHEFPSELEAREFCDKLAELFEATGITNFDLFDEPPGA